MGAYCLKILSFFSQFSWFAWILDAAILFLFIWIGLQQHEIITTDWYPLLAVLPFWMSWFVAGSIGGVFHMSTDAGMRERLLRLLICWVIALLLALVLRHLMFDKQILFSFGLVAFLFNGTLFSLWRVLFTRWYILPGLK
jgi:hypothetical protein